MNANIGNVYYPDYLQLHKLLDAQHPESAKRGHEAHDEMLFIIVHQAYELWFKQILHELGFLQRVFGGDRVADMQMGQVIARLERVRLIQQLMLQQIDVLETMTPLDFLEFRDLLVPASGFQSVQFKQIEIALGLNRQRRLRTDQEFLKTRLKPEDLQQLDECESRPSLAELVDRWLARMPFLEFEKFDFWRAFSEAVDQMLDSDRHIIQTNPVLSDAERNVQLNELQATRSRFAAVLDKEQFDALREAGEFRLSHRAILAALFIHLYRDEPMLYLPFKFLTHLVDIDEMFTAWRTRHAIMAQRMLGTKIGTGGSAGHDYLSRTARNNRVFTDLFSLSTFLIPRSSLPELPQQLRTALGFFFSGVEK